MRNRYGFTLIELLVVMAMLGILGAASGVAIANANKRAKIAKATTEVRELQNALLAYEMEHNTLDPFAGGDQEANEKSLAELTGGGRAKTVYYNASFRAGKIVDPWGNALRFRVTKGAVSLDNSLGSDLKTIVTFPNRNRQY